MADGILTPCNVACAHGSGLNRDSEFTKWQHPAMSYVALGWHAIEFAQTTAILEFYMWFRFRPYHRSRHCHSAPVCKKSDHPQQKRMTSCRFSRWRITAILDFRGPIMGSSQSPCTTSYRSLTETVALNWLVFEKIAFCCIVATDRQTDRRTDGQARCMKPLWLSRLNNPSKLCTVIAIL